MVDGWVRWLIMEYDPNDPFGEDRYGSYNSDAGNNDNNSIGSNNNPVSSNNDLEDKAENVF